MPMKNKVLMVAVTRNHPVQLQNLIDSMNLHCSGYDYDFLIVDASSDNLTHLKILDKLSKKYNILSAPNNRVEANYNFAWERNKDYEHYLFLHDDSCINKDNWLKIYIDRMNSGYCEDIIKNTHLCGLPIGKVCVGTQPWRSYSSMLGYSVQCLFLKEVLDIIRPGKAPQIFKYGDGDRVLVNNECMNDTKGFRHIGEFKQLELSDKKTFDEISVVLDKYLQYYDVGCYPKDLYPPGLCWAKFSLTSEFLNSIDPLLSNWRTVGLCDDGYLEQIHGFDVPYSHNVIHHYGSPEFRQFLAKNFNTDMEEVRKCFENKVFLMKCDKLFKQYQEKIGK